MNCDELIAGKHGHMFNVCINQFLKRESKVVLIIATLREANLREMFFLQGEPFCLYELVAKRLKSGLTPSTICKYLMTLVTWSPRSRTMAF